MDYRYTQVIAARGQVWTRDHLDLIKREHPGCTFEIGGFHGQGNDRVLTITRRGAAPEDATLATKQLADQVGIGPALSFDGTKQAAAYIRDEGGDTVEPTVGVRMAGDDLRAWRERHGLSLADLADQLGGLDRGTVWRWEQGQRAIPPYLPLALETLERRQVETQP